MELTNSILEDVRVGVGLEKLTTDFDTELLMHINSAISVLSQNGVNSTLIVNDDSKTWNDLQDPLQIEGNKSFHMIPLFITLSTKQIFDPPPPSTIEYYSRSIDQLLWRLKVAYEEPSLPVIVTVLD